MKQLLRQMMIIAVTALLCQQLKAQSYSGNEGTLRFFELKDMDGGLIKTASEMGVNGSPMLFPDWSAGTIHFQSGKVFADSAMNFSLYTHTLFIKRDNRFFEIVQPVASVTLRSHDENANEIIHTIKSGFPAVNGHDTTTMYEVLFEGENLKVLTWAHKKVIETFNYGAPRAKEYQLIQQFYVFIPQENKITILNSYTVAALKKTLPSYADAIQAYCTQHNINTKSKSQINELLAYLDSKH